MRILHVNGFSEDERKQKIEDIKKNIRDAILTLEAISNRRFGRFSQGRPTARTSANDRYFTLCTRRNRTATPTLLRFFLVSMSTVCRRLYEGGFHKATSHLLSRHRRDRLQWGRHVHWTPDQWRAVFFTNESRFSLESDSRRYLIWREPGTHYHPSNICERYAYRRGSVCVWGSISLSGGTDLDVFPRGTMNDQVYRDDILDAYMRPYAGAISDAFLLQDDNARPHRVSIVDDYLQQETIMGMEWPARSPDLNPNEHVWDALGRRLAALNLTLRLLQCLQEQWLSLPVELTIELPMEPHN
ncbi:Transposable element Tcb1 transposase, partial [Stegodyphus mimosarum]